jgi:hypothetical protein
MVQLEAGAERGSLAVAAAAGGVVVRYRCSGAATGADAGAGARGAASGAAGGEGRRGAAAAPAEVARELAVALPPGRRISIGGGTDVIGTGGGGVRSLLVPGGRLVVIAGLE